MRRIVSCLLYKA
uniref:Uncharacterized protein n=1 Tax=Rhizophora mucronata TaxID=61149 RepID=A0A2P2K2L7_RHIMU